MKRSRRNHGEINYWQSNTDLLTGFVLVLLLIIMLLMLYIFQLPQEEHIDDASGSEYYADDDYGDDDDDGWGAGWGDWDDDDGGGGGDDETETEESTYEYPYPASGGDDWAKAAVFATVIDGETGRAIRVPGITFELYEEQIRGVGGAKRFLNTYYPEKIEYRTFATTDEGVFYLPEKIEEGHYYFTQITGLDGYDWAETVHFDVDQPYDWPDPFVVSIELYPSKNIIPVRLQDADTKEPITGGSFRVTAAEDVITADSTVRFYQNELADTIELDEEGYGESRELYLGTYLVAQDSIPQYYASVDGSVETEVEQYNGYTPAAITFSAEKTRISLSLTDELYTDIKLAGSEFVLSCEDHPELEQTGITGADGSLTFENLEKNRVYRLQQVSSEEGYRYDDTPLEIYVDREGRINGEARAVYELTNLIPRVQIAVNGMFFTGPASNVSVALYSADGELVQSWTNGGTPVTFEDLPAGDYYVVVDGKESKHYDFTFADDVAMQNAVIRVWTTEDIIVVAMGGGVLLLAILLVTFLLTRRRSANKKDKKDKEGTKS